MPCRASTCPAVPLALHTIQAAAKDHMQAGEFADVQRATGSGLDAVSRRSRAATGLLAAPMGRASVPARTSAHGDACIQGRERRHGFLAA